MLASRRFVANEAFTPDCRAVQPVVRADALWENLGWRLIKELAAVRGKAQRSMFC